MKRSFVVLAAMSVIFGCAKESISPDSYLVERQFVASYDAQTKTSIDGEGNVDWSQNDIISYYSAKNGPVGQHIVPSDCHSTSFTATVGGDDAYIVAVYGGAIDEHKGSQVTLTGVVGEVQSGLFKDAHVSVCKKSFEDGNTLSLQNITSIIKFSLTRTDISYVTFNADDGTDINGDGTLIVYFDGDDIDEVSFPDDDISRTKIRVNTGGAGTFYISTLPCTINGFSLKYYSSTGALLGETVTNKKLTLGVAEIINLGVLDSRVTTPAAIDLSASGTANSYIASKRDQLYTFNALVKGNSTEPLNKPRKVRVLWESFGSSEQPSVGDVISYVSFDKTSGNVSFIPYRDGNAVIAVKDADDEEILWSWHIWVCHGFNPVATEHVYNNSAGTMMDRNLGAISATPGSVGALGLMYEWGRKDPFLAGESITTNVLAKSTAVWPDSITPGKETGTIAYSVLNPMTYFNIAVNDEFPWNWGDWLYEGTGPGQVDNTRWQSTKTMYDPCPYGWRVPDRSVWSIAMGADNGKSESNWDDINKGMDFGKTTPMTLGSGLIWYPVTGHRAGEALVEGGNYGFYWSCTPNGNNAWRFGFDTYGAFGVDVSFQRTLGLSVRCMKE